MESSIEETRDYRPSGRFIPSRFVPGFLLSVIASAVMAWCLAFAFYRGFYLIFVAPLIAALAVAGVWHLVLRWSHCRNKRIATVGAVILGLGLYLGYYHVCLLRIIGYDYAGNVELLPGYVRFRMMTDVARDVRHGNRDRPVRLGPDRVQQAFNWFFFCSELALSVGLLTTVGRNISSRAYCEACKRWMDSESMRLPAGKGEHIWNSLNEQDYAEVRKQLAGQAPAGTVGCEVTLDHCPICPDQNRSQPVYLTIKDVGAARTGARVKEKLNAFFRPGPGAKLTTLVDHAALHSEEVAPFVASLPKLKNLIEAHPDQFAEVGEVAREIEHQMESPLDRPTSRLATIEAVEPGDAGRALTRWNAILQTIVGIGSVFGGFALAFLPVLPLMNQKPEPEGWVFGLALTWFFGILILNLVWILFFGTYLTSRFMLRRTRNAFEMRVNPAVDLHDPDLFFVDIVPRANWGKVMMENASDIGFLKISDAKRELIFEGDRERYWIPVESILKVEMESWADPNQHQLQTSPTLYHAVVVQAMTANGRWETWFYRRHNAFRRQTAKRRLEDALELETKIRRLMDTKTPA